MHTLPAPVTSPVRPDLPHHPVSGPVTGPVAGPVALNGMAAGFGIADATEVARKLCDAANTVIAGKSDVVGVAVSTLLAGGHLLIEDIPGVGKTLLAQALARSIGGSFRRVQGTSDLLPGDVTGSMVPSGAVSGGVSAMVFRPGPVFANVVVFDELNRTTPRTQSALLELAEESTVTVDGVSHRLPLPFMLVATQNPLDIAGTHRLGEGSLDRFAAVVSPGRAHPAAELDVLTGRRGRTQLESVTPVVGLDEVSAARQAVATVHVADTIAAYVISILEATRTHPSIRLGASTRGGVALLALARARAVMNGRGFVIPDDVVELAVPVLAHRIIAADAHASIDVGRALVTECLGTIAPPTV